MKGSLKLLRQIVLIIIFMAIAILLSQVILYDYASNDKTVSKVKKYERTEKVEKALSSNTDTSQNGESIEFTNGGEVSINGKYEVTNTDLNNYEKTNDYNPGKVNPFSSYTTDNKTGNDSNSEENNSNTENSGNNNSTDNKDENNNSSNQEKENSTNNNVGLTK